MNKEIEEKLVKDFPQIFMDWHGDIKQTCLAWGLEVEDGWTSLIRKLCEDIMAINPPDDFKATQVKEKFGGLRFYYSGGTKEISKLINAAQDESLHICESCGTKEDVTTEGMWVTTLCKKCREEITGEGPSLKL